MAERLTSLSVMKAWLGINGTDDDDLLRRLIEGASQLVLNYIGRETFTTAIYTDNFVGNGKGYVQLKNWPVLEVQTVYINRATITRSTFSSGGPSSGYFLGEDVEGPRSLDLSGYAFYQGVSAQVVYSAGYEAEQSFTIEADTPVFTTLYGQWIANLDVRMGDAYLTQVTADPTSGQYAVNEDGVYTFSNDDVGDTVVIRFNYAPMDISQATMELAGEAYRRRERIGQESKSMGGQQTAAYSQKDMNDTIKLSLNPYRRVVPI